MADSTPHFVVGHKNPDTDSIVAAHVLSWIHNQNCTFGAGSTPIRLGEANRQASWLFEQAGCNLPIQRKSCHYTAGEISKPVPVVDKDCALREALETMQRAQTEFVAVVDSEGKPLGIVSDRTPRTNYLLQCNIEDFVGTLLGFEHIIRGMPLKPLSGSSTPDIHSLEVAMQKSTRAGDWDAQTAVVIGDRELFLETINATPPGAVILTNVTEDRAVEIASLITCPAYWFSGSVINMLTRLPGCSQLLKRWSKNLRRSIAASKRMSSTAA